MNYPKSTKNNTVLIEVNKLPNLFRIEKIGVERGNDQSYVYKATLYSATQTLTVTWLSQEERKDLNYGVLVRGVWMTRRIFAQGTNIIQSLQKVKKLDSNESLANTVMKNWIYDGFAFSFIFDYIGQLPTSYCRLVTEVLSNNYVLYHFLKTPVALEGEFCKLGSNFQKTAKLLDFLDKNIDAHKVIGPSEALITAALLLGIGHYNQFEYDHYTLSYHSYSFTNLRDPKIVAIGLIQKAAESLNNIDINVINRIIAVIDHLEFDY